MTTPFTQSSLTEHDAIYESLLFMHEGRSEATSQKLNAKLILALVNQIGDPQTVRKLIAMVISNTPCEGETI